MIQASAIPAGTRTHTMTNDAPPDDDDTISLILSSDSADAQHPKVLAIGMQVCAGELTHAEARVLLSQALAEIIAQERSWESAFVN